ncbi:MAG: hypothetical protein BAJATHORv1_90056 [Candidatus Thorarchaeota archaeon]|nr:MAG: hypothetical protein BAJATHORv1_90056 [Candidatus Thorarchaeota archaeon]
MSSDSGDGRFGRDGTDTDNVMQRIAFHVLRQHRVNLYTLGYGRCIIIGQ